MAYDQATMAKIAALQSAMFGYSPSAKGQHGEELGSKRVASDAQIAQLSNDLWATPDIDRAGVTEQYLTHHAGTLSKIDTNLVQPGIEALVATGIGAGVAGVAGVGPAAAGGGTETGALLANGTYDVASTASPIAAAGMGEYPGAVAAGAAGGAAAGAAANSGGGAAVPGAATGTTGTVAGTTTAAPAAATVPAASTAATVMQGVKDYGGIALTLGGLLAGAVGGGGALQEAKTPDAPAPEAPPESQASKQPDELARRKANPGGGDDTLLTGASGIDPFSLNIGRNKLLGQ